MLYKDSCIFKAVTWITIIVFMFRILFVTIIEVRWAMLAMTAVTGSAYAESIDEAKQKNQEIGQSLLNNFKMPSMNNDTGDISATNTDGSLSVNLNKQDFFKTDDPSPPDVLNHFSQGMNGGDDALKNTANNYFSSIENRDGEEDTTANYVYDILLANKEEGMNADRGSGFDLEPVREQIDLLRNNGCYVEETVNNVSQNQVWLPDEKHCEAMVKPSPCVLTRRVNAQQNVRTIFSGRRCVNTALDIEFKAYEDVNQVLDATLTGTNQTVMNAYQGFFQLSNADNPNRSGTYTIHPYTRATQFPFNEHTVVVDWHYDWHTNAPAADATFSLEKPTRENGWLGKVHLLHTKTGHWQHDCDPGILFDFSIQAVVENAEQMVDQSPEGCFNVAQNDLSQITRQSPFCNIDGWRCTDSAEHREFDGVDVTQDKFHFPELSPGVATDPICYQARIDFNCNFNAGTVCLTNSQGQQECYNNNIEQSDTCSPYQDVCRFVDSHCIEGGRDPATNICFIEEKIYDCGHFTTVGEERDVTRRVVCPNQDIHCVGSECVDNHIETNADFAQAAAQIRALDTMMMDKSCQSSEGEDESVTNCSVFNGHSGSCKKAVGGTVNCCEDLEGVSLVDYMNLAYTSWDVAQKMELAEKLAEAGLDIPGAWSSLREGGSAIWDNITDPFVSAWDSLASQLSSEGAATTLEGAAVNGTSQISISSIKQTLMSTAHEWIAETFGPETADLFFTQGGSGWALATPLSTILWVYTAYQVAIILIKIIYRCENDEYELVVKRQLKSCHYVGSYCDEDILGLCTVRKQSYCCYASPLARIFQEQLHLQPGNNRSWGTAESPICDGIYLSDLQNVNWHNIDLSEWTGILTETGIINPSAGYAFSTITRNQHAASDTPDAAERTEGFTRDIDIDDVRHNVSDRYWQSLAANANK